MVRKGQTVDREDETCVGLSKIGGSLERSISRIKVEKLNIPLDACSYSSLWLKTYL